MSGNTNYRTNVSATGRPQIRKARLRLVSGDRAGLSRKRKSPNEGGFSSEFDYSLFVNIPRARADLLDIEAAAEDRIMMSSINPYHTYVKDVWLLI